MASFDARNSFHCGLSSNGIRLFPTVLLYYNLVLDHDALRLELDYRSIMHIKVKMPSNQDSATRMALKPVRVQIMSLEMVA